MDQRAQTESPLHNNLPEPFYRRTSVLVAACIVIGFILLTPFFFYLRSTRKPVPLERITPSVSHTQDQSAAVENGQYVYQTRKYKAYYPKDWIDTTKTYNASPGALLVLKPATGNTNAKIAVEVMDPGIVSYASLSGNLTFLGFQKTSAKVAGTPAEKFQGSITIDPNVIHNTVYLFEAKQQIYMIKLSYNSDAVDTNLESQFLSFVKQFTL